MGAVQQKLVNLGISTVVVGGVAAYAYFGTYKTKKAEDEQKQADEKVVTFKLADVKELTLTAKGETFVIAAEGEGENKWKLLKPLATTADKATVEGLINHFAEMKKKRSIDARPEDLANFGLQPPQQTVAFETTDGKTTTFLVGKKNAFDDNVYLKRNDETSIAMVPAGIVYQTDRDLFALRDKRLLSFEDRDARKIEVSLRGAPAYILEKNGEDWHLRKPIAAKADKTQVSTILSTLRYLRAKAFAAENRNEDDKFGLKKPDAVVSLSLGDSGALLRIAFSTVKAKGGGEQWYAAVDGQKTVAELGDAVHKKIDLKAADLRDKQVLGFNSEEIMKLKLAETGKDFVVFEKKEQWEMIAPEQKSAEGSKIKNLLLKLSTVRAKSVLADTASDELKNKHGLDPVSKQITLYKADGSEAGTLIIGNTDGELTAVLAQGSHRIDGVEKTQFADLSFDAKDYLKAETAASTPPEQK